MIIVWPRALSSSTSSSRRCTTTGASPSESSSISRTSGSWISTRREREHLLLAAREAARRAACAAPSSSGNSSSTVVDRAASTSAAAAAVEPRAHRAGSASTVRLGNTPLPPGQLHDARCLHALLGRDVRDVAAVEPHHAALGHLEAADDAQDRRLARAVRAEQRDALAPLDLEVDVEEHLHRAVGEVDVRDLEDAASRAFGSKRLRVLVLLLEQLLDDEREVVADEARAVHQQQRRR